MKNNFRDKFTLPKTLKINWFPGHMAKTYKLLPEQIKKVDIFLEIRDSRIPFTSGNTELDFILTPNVKRFVLFNKFDLCDQVKSQLT